MIRIDVIEHLFDNMNTEDKLNIRERAYTTNKLRNDQEINNPCYKVYESFIVVFDKRDASIYIFTMLRGEISVS